MADESDTTPIHSRYAQRFAADLDVNRKEQESLAAQITELEARLKQLKSDESWLSGMQGTLAPAAEATATRSPAAKPAATPVAVPGATPGVVPKPRQAKKAAVGTSRAKKATPAKKAGRTTAAPVTEVKAQAVKAKQAPRKADTTTAGKATSPAPAKTEPPLRELVLALLVGAAEPRLVNEITAELAQAHPGRPASTQVVRNTLEALTKKGAIEKEHKQGSVMYTATATAPASTPAGTPAPAAAEVGAAAADVTAEKPAVKV
ncbi:hypothetical protein ABZY44_15330 [Streptomyces sp. NPDC006544]|uniref:hypothetical protein n=1 Tax=Streptomyces sp. NPDC006544 TaxID=3154583 RepID=UPI0033B7FCFF